MAYTSALEVTFEMVDYGVNSLAASAATLARTATQLNAGDFDGNPLFYFEIVVNNGHASNDYDVSLYDSTNSATKVSITVPYGASNTRYRSAAFSPAAGEVVYKVLLAQTAADGNVGVLAARIVVVQDATATKTVVDVPLLGYDRQSLVTGETTPVDSHQSASYAQGTTGYYPRWLKTASNWATVSGCALDAVIRGVSYTATIAIVDIDNSNTAVTGTELTSDSGSVPAHVYGTFAWADMTDGHNFEIMSKIANVAGTVRLYRASMRIFLSDLQKGEIYRRVGMYRANTTAAYFMNQRQIYTAANYTSPTCYFEATGKCADNANVASLHQVNADTGSTGTAAVSGSDVNWNSSTKARFRSAAITPTTGYNLYFYQAASTGTQTVSGELLVVAFAGASASSFLPRAALLGVG